MRITVDVDAVFQITPEKTEFPAAADTNRYRKLAEYWDPFVAQETGWQAKADIRTRFDFDGDWNGDNNWDNTDSGTSQAYVHLPRKRQRRHRHNHSQRWRRVRRA